MSKDRLHRITFAQSVAERCALSGPEFQVQRIKLRLGRELKPGEESRNGLYAIVSRQKEKILRVTLMKSAAEIMCDNESRYLRECFLLP